MYRIIFKPKLGMWVIQLSTMIIFWSTIRKRGGKELELFDTYDNARAYIVGRGIDNVYKNYNKTTFRRIWQGEEQEDENSAVIAMQRLRDIHTHSHPAGAEVTGVAFPDAEKQAETTGVGLPSGTSVEFSGSGINVIDSTGGVTNISGSGISIPSGGSYPLQQTQDISRKKP